MLTGTGAFDLSDVALQIRWSFNFQYCLSDMFPGKRDLTMKDGNQLYY